MHTDSTMGGLSAEAAAVKAYELVDARGCARLGLAETARGSICRPCDPEAVRFDIYGACARVCNSAGIVPPPMTVWLDHAIEDVYSHFAGAYTYPHIFCSQLNHDYQLWALETVVKAAAQARAEGITCPRTWRENWYARNGYVQSQLPIWLRA